MKSLQDYINIYSNIASELNLQGDSVQVLIQMLSNASYINEVENISYVQESSLEKSTLLNSKIQHCMDEMYSVYRGNCPRVILNFTPKKYFSFNVFDEILSSSNFKVYYLGYYKHTEEEITSIPEFTYSPITIPPNLPEENTQYTLIGLIAKEVVSENWTLNQNNTYYVDCQEDNLSNDMWLKMNNSFTNVTRDFSTHILENSVFDLTLPSFGSRLYVTDIFKEISGDTEIPTPANTTIEALYYKFSVLLEDYNESELMRVSLKGADFVPLNITSDLSFPGIYYLKESERNDLNTIHYKANRNRFVNSIFRSNDDIGAVLEEMYPNKVKSNGTSYEFFIISNNSTLSIYYVPISRTNVLTEGEIEKFITDRKAYYVTDLITVQKGAQYTAIFNINLELYQNSNVEEEVKNILLEYQDKFNIILSEEIENIMALISKISNVKKIISLDITYLTENGEQLTAEEILSIETNKSYFQINYVINSIIQSK